MTGFDQPRRLVRLRKLALSFVVLAAMIVVLPSALHDEQSCDSAPALVVGLPSITDKKSSPPESLAADATTRDGIRAAANTISIERTAASVAVSGARVVIHARVVDDVRAPSAGVRGIASSRSTYTVSVQASHAADGTALKGNPANIQLFFKPVFAAVAIEPNEVTVIDVKP